MTGARPVVVGVDGSEIAWTALDWAAAEAHITARPLLIVHAGDVTATETAPAPYGRELLGDAVARLAEGDLRIPIATELRPGAPDELLLELSREADLLVVGTARPGRLNPLALGSVPQRVLGRSRCPVVVVRQPGIPDGPVLVGVSSSAGGLAAMRFAAEEARRRGSVLVAARYWTDAQWSGETVGEPMPDVAGWERRERALLDAWLERARTEFPDVTIVDQLAGTPVHWALEAQSLTAGLLVLGCRRTVDARLPRLGPVTHWAVHHAMCPVAVVGHTGYGAAGGGGGPDRGESVTTGGPAAGVLSGASGSGGSTEGTRR